MEHLHVLGFISYVSKIRDYDMQNVAKSAGVFARAPL